MTDWRTLVGHDVTVTATGLVYRGRVVELGVHSLLLKTPAGFREIPWERITRVSDDGKPTSGRLGGLSGGK